MSDRALGLLTIGWLLFFLGDTIVNGIGQGARDAGLALIVAAVLTSLVRPRHDD